MSRDYQTEVDECQQRIWNEQIRENGKDARACAAWAEFERAVLARNLALLTDQLPKAGSVK